MYGGAKGKKICKSHMDKELWELQSFILQTIEAVKRVVLSIFLICMHQVWPASSDLARVTCLGGYCELGAERAGRQNPTSHFLRFS
jgi:hypothetical protein